MSWLKYFLKKRLIKKDKINWRQFWCNYHVFVLERSRPMMSTEYGVGTIDGNFGSPLEHGSANHSVLLSPSRTGCRTAPAYRQCRNAATTARASAAKDRTAAARIRPIAIWSIYGGPYGVPWTEKCARFRMYVRGTTVWMIVGMTKTHPAGSVVHQSQAREKGADSCRASAYFPEFLFLKRQKAQVNNLVAYVHTP